MKKIILLYTKFLIIYLIIIASFMLTTAYADECSFDGTINGKNVKKMGCEVAQAGTKAYMLFSVMHNGQHWMLDLSGITRNEGETAFSLSVMEYHGKKIVERYLIQQKMTVKGVQGVKDRFYIKGSFDTKSKNGKSAIINGTFSWSTNKFPPEPLNGSLTFHFGTIDLKPDTAKLQSWNLGFQINKIFLVKGGETLNTTLEIPSNKEGSFKGRMTVMHFWSEGGDIKSEFLNSNDMSITIKKDGKGLNISFKGTVIGSGKKIEVSGSFVE